MKKLFLMALDFFCRLANGGKGIFALQKESAENNRLCTSLSERCLAKQQEILMLDGRVIRLLAENEEARWIATCLQGIALERDAIRADRDHAVHNAWEQRIRADKAHAAEVSAELRAAQMGVYWQKQQERAEKAEAQEERVEKISCRLHIALLQFSLLLEQHKEGGIRLGLQAIALAKNPDYTGNVFVLPLGHTPPTAHFRNGASAPRARAATATN